MKEAVIFIISLVLFCAIIVYFFREKLSSILKEGSEEGKMFKDGLKEAGIDIDKLKRLKRGK